MRRLPFLASALLAFFFTLATSFADSSEPDFLKPDTNILFLGDSITQGGTYIAYIQSYLWQRYPDRNYNLINLGLGSETASGLSETDHPFPRPNIHARIDRALAAAKPDLTFICYGMNDGIYHPASKKRFAAHRDGMLALIEKVRATGSEIILLTPPPFDAETKRLKGGSVVDKNAPDFGYKTPYEKYDSVLQGYGKWVLRKHNGVARSIDIHTPVKNDLATIRASYPDYEYGDGIHPNDHGHFIIARSILEALDAPGIDLLPDSSKPTPDSNLTRAMPLILERHGLISAAWREHVGHSKPKKEDVPPLPEAQRQADSMEVEIRSILSKPERQVRRMSQPVGDHQLEYLLQTPSGEKPDAGWPLLLFLHGYGECGDKIEAILKHGPPKLISQFEVLQGAVIVSPQCPKKSWWRTEALKALVDEVIQQRGDIDPKRLYITGLSMGGYGTWSFVSRYPSYFAAAIPICGGGDPFNLPANRPPIKSGIANEFLPQGLAQAKDLPIWAFHGARDSSVPIKETQALVDLLKQAGSDHIKFTTYPEARHVQTWQNAYSNPEVWQWLFSQ